MELKPGYKQTELGVIPEEWEVKPLGELAEFVTSGSRGWAEFYSESGALFIRSQNVRDGRLSFEDTQHVRPPSGAEGNRTKVYRNDLLITITGNSVGNVALVEQDFKEAYISQHVGMVRLHEAELGEYVCRYLSPNSPGNSQIAGSQSGQSKPGLNLQNLRDFRIAVPPTLSEQRAIATALSDVDALIASLDKLIAKKRDMKQAAMQELLTAKRRLPGFSGEWEVKRLGEVCRILTGKKDVNEGNPAGAFPFFTCSKSHTYSDSYSFDTEAILVAGNGDVGNLHYYNGKFEAYQRTYVLSDFLTNVVYLWQQLTAHLVDSLGIGKIGSSIPYIKKENLVDFEFSCPESKAEQTAIAAILSDMDTEIASLEQKRDKSRQLKQGMMQELLTGRIRLV